MSVIGSNPTWLTPDWLTETFHRNGHLTRGRVNEISVETFQSYFADFYRLGLTYSAETAPRLPAHLILKIPFADNDAALAMGRDEVFAYQKLWEAMPAPPLVRCFDAAEDPATGFSHLLLEDLSATHFRGDAPDDVCLRQWQFAAEALADLHAFWWEHETLGCEIGQFFSESDIETAAQLNYESLHRFLVAMGSEVDAATVSALEDTIKFLPGFWRRRLTSRTGNTLIHGDAHSWNILLPHDETTDRAYLIDLATMRVRPATNDLAYLMALKWNPERRARLEMPLLRHYHQVLLARGIKNYGWDDCLLDYRYSTVTHFTTPVVQCGVGFLSPGIWRANFKRIAAAFHDLNCSELIAEARTQ
jgi:hypothetical protein